MFFLQHLHTLRRSMYFLHAFRTYPDPHTHQISHLYYPIICSDTAHVKTSFWHWSYRPWSSGTCRRGCPLVIWPNHIDGESFNLACHGSYTGYTQPVKYVKSQMCWWCFNQNSSESWCLLFNPACCRLNLHACSSWWSPSCVIQTVRCLQIAFSCLSFLLIV